MIPNKAFLLTGDMEIVYKGRAISTLQRGCYLLMVKPDKSISIHGARAKPLNYQNPNSTLSIYRSGVEFDDIWQSFFSVKPQYLIHSTNRNEALIIAVFDIKALVYIDNLSDYKIKLTRSEKELVQQLITNISLYLPELKIVSIRSEAPTPYGNVDVEIVDNEDRYHLIEAKRRIVSLAGCGQISRYAKYYQEQNKKVKEYVAGPTISRNALKYCQQNNQTWIKIDFDQRA